MWYRPKIYYFEGKRRFFTPCTNGGWNIGLLPNSQGIDEFGNPVEPGTRLWIQYSKSFDMNVFNTDEYTMIAKGNDYIIAYKTPNDSKYIYLLFYSQIILITV